MKTLLVLRHAKASQDSASGLDFDRPLKPRGQRQALALGHLMRERCLAVDAILASPAARVVETMTGLIEGAGLKLKPGYDRRIYDASPQTLLEVVREADDKLACLLIAGHNPGLQSLVLHLAQDDGDARRDDVAFSYPTATMVELCLAVEHWQDVERGIGRIVGLVRPED